jgi:hypothetical protein
MNMKWAECDRCGHSWNLAPWTKDFVCENCNIKLEVFVVPCVDVVPSVEEKT